MVACALAILVMNGSAALAQPSPNSLPKWGPHIDFEAKPGTKRNIGEAALFAPLAQTDTTLLFADLRARFDDNDSREGNFGLGLRHMLPSGWNLGVYGYYDSRRSAFDHYFNQATFGIEALGRDFDFRANAYLPFGGRVQGLGTTGGGDTFASLAGTTVLVTTPGTQTSEERALAGFDAEIGWRVPVWQAETDKALRLYAGLYHFDDDVVKAVTGPRLRAEFTMYEVPGLWEGTRLTLGAEYQHDDVRGGQGFALARLSIPLSPGRSEEKLTAQERRMTAHVVRDVDIVTETRTVQTTPAIVETATQTSGGSTITVLSSGSTTGAALPGAVTALANDSTIVLSGSFSTTASIDLAGNKSLMAGSITVRSPSGRTATLNAPATITGNTAGMNVNSIILAPGNNTISGLTLIGSGSNARGVHVNDTAGNVTISNNTISLTQTGAGSLVGVNLNINSNISVIGNNITLRGLAGQNTQGLRGGNTTNLTVAGNTFDVSGGAANRMIRYLGGETVTSGSTGNVRINGVCDSFPASGSAGFTDGTTCP